jgi:hypothetical protein
MGGTADHRRLSVDDALRRFRPFAGPLESTHAPVIYGDLLLADF